MKVNMSTKGQIVIPAHLRRLLNINENSVLDVSPMDGGRS